MSSCPCSCSSHSRIAWPCLKKYEQKIKLNVRAHLD